VDQGTWYREDAEQNNCIWARVRISDPRNGDRVRVLDRGGGCTEASVTPVSDFPGSVTWEPPRAFTYNEQGRYTGFSFNSRGTQLRSKTVTLDADTGAAARRRATPPGRQGRWLYVVDGPLSGRWIRDTARINLG
jgi:hypothetical protein